MGDERNTAVVYDIEVLAFQKEFDYEENLFCSKKKISGSKVRDIHEFRAERYWNGMSPQSRSVNEESIETIIINSSEKTEGIFWTSLLPESKKEVKQQIKAHGDLLSAYIVVARRLGYIIKDCSLYTDRGYVSFCIYIGKKRFERIIEDFSQDIKSKIGSTVESLKSSFIKDTGRLLSSIKSKHKNKKVR